MSDEEERKEMATMAARVGVGIGTMVAHVYKNGGATAETYDMDGKIILVTVSEYEEVEES